LNCRPLGY